MQVESQGQIEIYKNVILERTMQINTFHNLMCNFLESLPISRDTCQTFGYVQNALKDINRTLMLHHTPETL